MSMFSEPKDTVHKLQFHDFLVAIVYTFLIHHTFIYSVPKSIILTLVFKINSPYNSSCGDKWEISYTPTLYILVLNIAKCDMLAYSLNHLMENISEIGPANQQRNVQHSPQHTKKNTCM